GCPGLDPRFSFFAPWRRKPYLHPDVDRAFAALGRDPDDVLPRILDVAGLAVHAVRRVDLQPRVAAVGVAHDLVHGGRTIASLRGIVKRDVDLDLDGGI